MYNFLQSPVAPRTRSIRALGGLFSLVLGLQLLLPTGTFRRPTCSAGSAEEETPASSVRTRIPAFRAQLERLAQLGVDRWHSAGFRGKGIKVAVLDTGFRGYRNFLGRGLPDHVTAHSFRTDGNMEARDSQHGILCGEVIHALAPDAEILFADWDVGRLDEFMAAVRWARQEGARVINCSVITPSWSDGEGGGVVHQALAGLIGSGKSAADQIFFASAGNTIDRHWSGVYHAGTDGFHEWKTGQTDNYLRPWGNERVAVEAYWQPGADYDLFVYDVDTGKEVTHVGTDHNQGDRSSAVIRFMPERDHQYRVRLRLARGPAGHFHLTTTFASFDCTTPQASVCFPADGKEVIAMGAVDQTGHRMWYSACGPNSPDPKPDMVAPIPFPSLIRDRPFGGTSAASPQGAGLAALVLSRHPDWSPDRVRATMRTSAQDLDVPGPDFQTGYGLIHLPRD
jgi:subtilisin family serine protease